jgi:hypothetical protein
MPDPYVELSLGGALRKSAIVDATTEPAWGKGFIASHEAA